LWTLGNAGASDQDAAAAAADFSGDSFIKGLDPRITGQGIPDDPFADPRAFEGQGGLQQTGVQFGGYEIPGLNLGETELASGSTFLSEDPEGGAPYLNQRVQMLDRAGNPVLDASGQPVFYTARYDPTDQSLALQRQCN